MKRGIVFWIRIFALSFGVSLIISAIVTFLDWQKNPSGIFHSPQGTHWYIVWDTFISWLLPLLPMTAITFFLAGFIIARFRDSHTKT